MPFGIPHTVFWGGGDPPFGQKLLWALLKGGKGGTFFKHQVFERVGKSVILVLKKASKV